jgi:dephospho-CoA kinase
MKIIGIVGGVASGKSLVTECLAQLGVEIINADRVGHEVLREPEVIEQLRARWGAGVLTPEGQISRPAVARIVFGPGGQSDREFLERITHPRISNRITQILSDWKATRAVRAAAIDAALLLETDWARHCDEIWFIEAPDDVRRQRAIDRGWSEQQWREREAAQWHVDKKREHADVFIDNSGPRDETAEQVRVQLQLLLA